MSIKCRILGHVWVIHIEPQDKYGMSPIPEPSELMKIPDITDSYCDRCGIKNPCITKLSW